MSVGMIVTKKEVEIAGRKMIVETHLPDPNYVCSECNVSMPQRQFLYAAASFVALMRTFPEWEGQQGNKAFDILEAAFNKPFPPVDYSKIQSLTLNGVEFGPETEMFKSFYRMRNDGKEPPE